MTACIFITNVEVKSCHLEDEIGSSTTTPSNLEANIPLNDSVQLGLDAREGIPPLRPPSRGTRSVVWNHFTKFTNNDNIAKGKCKYCGIVYKCDSKLIGTINLKNHIPKCKMMPKNDGGR